MGSKNPDYDCILIYDFKGFLSHFGARYDKKWKMYQSKSEKSEKKSKIFGIKNFEFDMLDTVFRPQEHDALGYFFWNNDIHT